MINQQEIVAGFIDRAVENQTWYRKNANLINGTVAAVAGVLVYLVGYLSATGSWPQVEQFLVAIVPFVTAVSLKLTKNGIGKVQAAELKEKAEAELDKAEDVVEQPQPNYTPRLEDALQDLSGRGLSLDQIRGIIEQNR